MKNQEDQLKELVNNLEGLSGGLIHTRYCPKCRTLARHFSGHSELSEAQLRLMEAHLLAQIACRRD